MSLAIYRRHEVLGDILDLAEYISRDSVTAARRFVRNVEKTLEGLASMPRKGALREFDDPRLADVRSWPVDGFRNHPDLLPPNGGWNRGPRDPARRRDLPVALAGRFPER